MRIYTVREQWPHYEIASFWTLEDAEDFVRINRGRFALPLITSNLIEVK